ncbi:GNAT family N-acyltransferase [Sphingomonas sp.]|uniref:N-acyl amino acid synthase FeeM domain-containing protein n=1 Tax=Sphingomonas sp. TaxID=28214 RepID=UPI0025DB7FAA|nr:GNAT family N-acyltransferase [Sphingomonas sp.]
MSFKPPLVLQHQGQKSKFPLDLKVFAPGTDKTDIYRLRYRAFREAQLILPREDGLFFDDYDELETTCTLAAFNGDACVGSFRLTFGEGRPGAASMPCQSIFPAIGALEEQGYRRLVEFTRMAVAPEITNTSFRTTLYASLVRAGLIIAHAGEADYGLISVNPSQVRFYEMMCGFKALARADAYPGINAPAVLMGRNFRALNARRVAQNPFFRFSALEVSDARTLVFATAMGEAATA